jgi:predicted  nucleic acid-binding Zn-ribbon protein
MKFLVLFTLLFVASCGKDRLQVIHNQDKLQDLEARIALNEQLDSARDILIQMNTTSITQINQTIIDLESNLIQLINEEQQARIDGDEELAEDLASAIANQSLINLIVQSQLGFVGANLAFIHSRLNSLQSQINSTNSNLSSLSSQVNSLGLDLSALELRVTSVENSVLDLEDAIDELQLQIDEEGVQVFKCNAANSTERMFKINGKFYAVMNRVTTQQVQVSAGASSQTISIPLLCKSGNGNNLSLGPCGSGKSPVSGTGVTVTVPSNSSTSVSVVTGVKMALEPLIGSFITTDGGPACSFSVAADGTTTNLIKVQ